MPPRKEKASGVKKSNKVPEDNNNDTETTTPVSSPVSRSKTNEATNQTTLDKHLVSNTYPDELHTILKNVASKLNSLASQEYIESKFKELITEEFLSKKLKELETGLRLHVQRELDSVRQEVSLISDRVASIEGVVEILRNKVSDLETKNEALLEGNSSLVAKNNSLQEQVNDREIKIQSIHTKNNNLEQYTRRNSVRIYGIADEENETYENTTKKVTKVLSDKLKISISQTDIDISHRLGKFLSSGNRPIICKFVRRSVKHSVMRVRKMLKGSPMVIREDLTHDNAKLLEATSHHDSVKAAWSDEGRIVALLNNNRKTVIYGHGDLQNLS